MAQRLDASGAVLSSHLYEATEPYGYGGQSGYYTDRETGLQLLGFRYYDPAAGRFLTRDPIGYAGGANLYAYAGNSPVAFGDPSGLSGVDWTKLRSEGWRGWCSASSFVDTYVLGGGMTRFGSKVGCYEAGRESAWEVAKAGAVVVVKAGDAATTVVALPKAAVGLGRSIPGLVGKGGGGRWLPRLPFFRRTPCVLPSIPHVTPPVTGGAGPVRVGQAGLHRAGIVQNKVPIRSLSGTANYRIPDGLDDVGIVLTEVKNVKRLSYTRQLRDFHAWASSQPIPYTFELWVRSSTRLSQPLKDAIGRGDIVLRYLP